MSETEKQPQHTTACTECPFGRKVTPGALGAANPAEVFVGQAAGPFWLPCHGMHDFNDLAARLNRGNAQCAGAAIFRANVGLAEKMPAPLLHLPADPVNVFASFEEFYAHHKGVSLDEARQLLTPQVIERHRDDALFTAMARAAAGKAFVEIARKPKSEEGP